MIVVHNNKDPKKVSSLINSTIVDSDGENPDKYRAYSVTSTVTWPDPAAYNEPDTSDVNNLRDARNDVVNHAKVPDIAIGTPSSKLIEYVNKTGEVNLLITSPFGNWREYSTNGFCTISERVLLSPNELKMKNGVSYNIKNFQELLSGTSGGMLGTFSKFIQEKTNTLNALAETRGLKTAEKGEYITRFKEVPVVDIGETTTSGLDSLTFTFKFGQAQLFSAEEEVVKPILALANIFMPRQNGSTNRITTPYMTEIRAKTHMLASCLGTLGDGIKDLMGDITSTPTGADVAKNGLNALGDSLGINKDNSFVENAVSVANNITSKVFEGIDSAAKRALDETTTIILNIGGYVTGPYVASNISWDFDFNNVDEYGYPCQGSITFGGLKMIFLNCSDDVLKQWGYNVSGSGDNPFGKDSPTNRSLGAAYSDGKTFVGVATGETTY